MDMDADFVRQNTMLREVFRHKNQF
jgi:hypothetical protein